MENSSKIIILATMLFTFQNAFSQNEKAFCKAVDDLNFNKVERIVKKVTKKNSTGQTYFNGEGSGNQINFSPCYDSITNWLKNKECVEDAYWDKCQAKEVIFPGRSSIGVKFKTKNGTIEKCFLIQEGATGQINLFGWRPKIVRTKIKLVYIKMYHCENFIEQQKINSEKDQNE